jgi:prophage regulatory protein
MTNIKGQSAPNEALIRLDAVKAMTGLGRSTIYALAASGRFPRPIHIANTRISAWRLTAVSSWVAEQVGEVA